MQSETGEQVVRSMTPAECLRRILRFEKPEFIPNYELLREIIETRTELALRVLDKVMDAAPFTILHFWEDAACNSGPLIAPDVFEELAVPAYRRIVDLFRAKGGEIVSLDSDGDIWRLIPGWIAGGIDHLWPMEVRAGMDVAALRRQFGHAFSMRGGIEKMILFEGDDVMRRELERVAPVVEDGGYMPMIDHSVPSGVTFDAFCRYMELKQEILGIRCEPRRPGAP